VCESSPDRHTLIVSVVLRVSAGVLHPCHRQPAITSVMFRRSADLAIATAAVAAAGMIAACGSGSPSSSSAGGHPIQAQVQQEQRELVRFATCMRSHRVPNLPDPTTSPREFKDALETRSPAFQSAATACQHLLPGGSLHSPTDAHSQAHIAAMLAFARCMRSHGFPSFPDPTSTGLVSREMLANAGGRAASVGVPAGRRRLHHRHPRVDHHGRRGPRRRRTGRGLAAQAPQSNTLRTPVAISSELTGQ
jgi:hypothetical protein